jgi:hypothetical protein
MVIREVPSTNGKLQSELMVKHREGARLALIATLEQGEVLPKNILQQYFRPLGINIYCNTLI